MSDKVMTIARGLTRLKTIKGQLARICEDIQNYGTWIDKQKHPLGECDGIQKSLNIAKEKIKSLYQSHGDLVKEYISIKYKIDDANLKTTIVVKGTTMTLHEALCYKREIVEMIGALIRANSASVNKAQQQMAQYNAQFANANTEVKDMNKTDVVYLVSQSKVKELNEFMTEFVLEVDGELNSINALTEI